MLIPVVAHQVEGASPLRWEHAWWVGRPVRMLGCGGRVAMWTEEKEGEEGCGVARTCLTQSCCNSPEPESASLPLNSPPPRA